MCSTCNTQQNTYSLAIKMKTVISARVASDAGSSSTKKAAIHQPVAPNRTPPLTSEKRETIHKNHSLLLQRISGSCAMEK
jgi:hypothetical protein